MEKLKCQETWEKAKLGEIKINSWHGWFNVVFAATDDRDYAEEVANDWALQVMKAGGKPNA